MGTSDGRLGPVVAGESSGERYVRLLALRRGIGVSEARLLAARLAESCRVEALSVVEPAPSLLGFIEEYALGCVEANGSGSSAGGVAGFSEALKPSRAIRRADRFHFGFCNACERYACGESVASLEAYPTRESVVTSADEAYAVMAGVHAAIAALGGEVDAAMHTALEFGLSQGSREGLRDLVLSA